MFDFFFLLGSGQQILGPPRKKQTSDDFTQSMFDEAKRYLSRIRWWSKVVLLYMYLSFRLGS